MKRAVTILLAALALLGAWSCSKEYWEEQEAKKEAARQEKISTYWSVVGKLVSARDRTDDYADKTFEPIIGTADPSDPQTRIVATNTLENARQRFAGLIGVDVSEIGSSYTFKNDEIGTLVYTEGGSSLATVEVNIKQIPHLSRIRYATPEQKGDNGKFDGAAYYRFGDVVSTVGTRGPEFWICVRPAFGKEGKEKTHWITVSPVGPENVLNYSSAKSSNKREYNIQDNLKYDTEHMQNLAELLFAICFPNTWHDNVTDIPSMKMFHDFDKENIRFHNEQFWKNVQKAWEDLHLGEMIFGKELSYFAEHLQSDGLYLLYDESTWNTWFYNGPTVHQAHYSNTKGTTNANMHTAKYSKVQHDVINKKDPSKDMDYNVLVECTNQTPYLVKPEFFGDSNPRWIVRYAEGCELSSTGKYGDNDVRSPIPGVTEIYRYYENVYQTNDLANADLLPEVSGEEPLQNGPTNGAGLYMPGDVLEDQDGNRWICILGSPWYPMFSSITDHAATFISFGFNGINTQGNKVSGLPDEQGAIKLGVRLMSMLNSIVGATKYQYSPGETGHLGLMAQHMLDYGDLDIRKALMAVDSTWTFTGWNVDGTKSQEYHSESTSMLFNLAYDDGTPDKQALLRVVYDMTQCGNMRTSCSAKSGNKYADAFYRLYKHYETFDPSRMREATEDEKSLGMTTYCLPWAMTTDKIYLQDIADQAMVDRHAKDDKWVRLPLASGPNQPAGARRTPRTKAESVKPGDFIGKYGKTSTTKGGMFNEPVLFVRVMYVDDNGGNKPNLVSQDGRKLKVVHLQGYEEIYSGDKQATWSGTYAINAKLQTTLDNVQYTPPAIPGLPL